MRIGIVTDAWHPQTNGVVTTLGRTAAALEGLGHTVSLMTPAALRTLPCPSYPEIRLAVLPGRRVRRWLAEFVPEALHIATEGPLGFSARAAARSLGLRFTTSYHTRFPEYLRARYPIPAGLSYRLLRHFHGAAARTMVATPKLREQLHAHGFRNLALWSRGVDTELFTPARRTSQSLRGPVLVCVGRVAVEKGVEDFCRLEFPGTRVVVGDGPQRAELARRYPEVVFTGFLHGEALATFLASADCLVFPSRTDTFGLVMIEAMAAGVPVAAYPVAGPLDVVQDGVTGCLHHDLREAVAGALRLDRRACRRHAETLSWASATRQFLENLVEAPVRATQALRAGRAAPAVINGSEA